MKQTSEAKEFFKGVSALSISRGFEFFSGLIRVKLSAIYLGVKGVGILDQLLFFAQQTASFTMMSLPEGMVKQIAEKKDKEEINKVISSTLKGYLLIVSIIFLLVMLVMITFSDLASISIFGSSDLLYVYFIALLCIPILILNSIPFAILKAFKATKDIAKARTIIVLINLVIILPLIIKFGLNGMLFYVLLSYFNTLCINFYFAKKRYISEYEITFASIRNAKVSSSKMKELLAFATFGATVGVFAIVSELIIRSILVTNIGIESIGLYSPIIMLASLITGILLPAFSTYLYPRFCEFETLSDVSDLINVGIRIGTIILIPFVLIIIPMRSYLIQFIYSNEFVSSSDYLPIHFIGLIFYLWWFVLSQSLTPTGRIKQHGFMITIFYVLNMLTVYFLVNDLELLSYAIKFLIPPILIFFIYFIYCSIVMNLKISKQNKFLMIYSILSAILIIYIEIKFQNLYLSLFFSTNLILLTYFLMSKEERIMASMVLRKPKDIIK